MKRDDSPSSSHTYLEQLTCEKQQRLISKLEEDLHLAHGLIQSITQGTGDLIAALDCDYHVIFCNEAHRQETIRLWGQDIKSGMNMLDILAPWPEEMQKAKNIWGRAFNGETFSLTIEFGPSETKNQFFRMRFKPIYGRRGQLVGASHIMRNITEKVHMQQALQESENKFKKIFNSRQNIIAITSIEEGRFIEVNDSFERITGYSRKEAVGCTVNELGIWPHFEDPAGNGLANTRGQPGSIETILKTKTGEFRTGIFWSDVVIIEGREYLLSEWLDITKRKEAEKALLQLNKTLEQQVAERTKLAEARAMELQSLTMEIVESEERVRKRIAMLLHEDLQQLLAGTKLQLQAACQSLPENISLEKFLQVDALMTESIQKSRCLSHELSPPILHQSGLIPGLEWLCRHMNEQFGLHVSLKSDTSLSIDNLTVKVFLYRAVQELLFNIVKHAHVKNAVVHLFDSASFFSLTVSDEGQGFDPDAFKSTTEKMGFGLMNLRERSRSLGGDLVIESAPGQGSQFTVTVPISLTRLPDTPHLNPHNIDNRLAYASQKLFVFGKIRVLFADDHHVMRRGLIEMVRGDQGIEVVGEAANGKEAIVQVRKLKPEVVVMDVSMPKMNGMEATREIKTKWPDVRVIGLSMYEDAHIAQAMRRAGAEMLLSKTASSSELLQAIYGKASGL